MKKTLLAIALLTSTAAFAQQDQLSSGLRIDSSQLGGSMTLSNSNNLSVQASSNGTGTSSVQGQQASGVQGNIGTTFDKTTGAGTISGRIETFTSGNLTSATTGSGYANGTANANAYGSGSMGYNQHVQGVGNISQSGNLNTNSSNNLNVNGSDTGSAMSDTVTALQGNGSLVKNADGSVTGQVFDVKGANATTSTIGTGSSANTSGSLSVGGGINATLNHDSGIGHDINGNSTLNLLR